MLSTMMRRVVRLSLGCSVAFGGVFAASAAQANPAFPMELQQAVPMPCVPACTLCHATTAGGPGNERPSGIIKTWTDATVVMGAPLDGYNASSLGPVVMEIKALNPPLDSDKDGIPDITELMMGEDPSDPKNATAVCAAGPTYGCVHVAPNGKVDNVAAAASAIVGLLGIAAVRRRVTKKRARRV
jgi:hypothetical protein